MPNGTERQLSISQGLEKCFCELLYMHEKFAEQKYPLAQIFLVTALHAEFYFVAFMKINTKVKSH